MATFIHGDIHVAQKYLRFALKSVIPMVKKYECEKLNGKYKAFRRKVPINMSNIILLPW